jgi:hypothetical protein
VSVEGYLEQMPPQVLEQLRQSRYSSEFIAKLELYNAAKEISEPEKWESELQKDSSFREYIPVLKSSQADVISIIQSTQALIKSAQVPELDLGRQWQDILSFLTGEFYPENLSYNLSERDMNGISIALINAVGGQRFKYNRDMYEAFIDEADVARIATALNLISENFSSQWSFRWEHLVPEMTAFGETDEDEFAELFRELLDFYQDSALQGSAVFVSIG